MNCKMCGALIEDGKLICEKCRNSIGTEVDGRQNIDSGPVKIQKPRRKFKFLFISILIFLLSSGTTVGVLFCLKQFGILHSVNSNAMVITDLDLNADHQGNTSGNIANAGIVMEQGDWIYYSTYHDDDTNAKAMYKIRSDGTGKTKLFSGGALCINVVDNWIYFMGMITTKDSSGKNIFSVSMYKIRTDGTEKTVLADDGFRYLEGTYQLNVVGDWIYYIKHQSSNGEKYYVLSKIRTDGTEKKELGLYNIANIFVDKGWIYYVKYGDLQDTKLPLTLDKMRTDGTEKTLLDEDYISNMIVVDGWIYYVVDNNDSSDRNHDSYTIYKMRTDGTGKAKVSTGDYSNINVYQNWIYYNNNYNYKTIYKIRTDGTELTKLGQSNFNQELNVIDGWIYYTGKEDGKYVFHNYKIRTDGADDQVLN